MTVTSRILVLGTIRAAGAASLTIAAFQQPAGKQPDGRSIRSRTSWQVPSKFAGYAAPAAARLRSHIEVIFNELK